MKAIQKATIRIKNLALRTIIGFNSWEREKKQDIIINISMTFNPEKAVNSDCVEDTLDYKKIKRKIINFVENSSFNLLETLTHNIVEIIASNKLVLDVTVKIDKLHALRFAESVSVEMSYSRER